MDSITLKHIEKGKYQVVLILILAALTFLSSIFGLGLGSSSSLSMGKTWKIVLSDMWVFLINLDTVFDNLSHNIGCIPADCESISLLHGLNREGTHLQNSIIYEWRLPRILAAVIGGIALAVAGSLMQGCLGNPLVSPLTLGVASGAALGAAA